MRSRSRSRWIVRGAALVVLAGALIGGVLGWRVVTVGTAYVAKTACSRVFVSRRDVRSVLDEEIRLTDPGLLRFLRLDVDRGAGMARSSLLGLGERVAVFREGLGCTLAIGIEPQSLAARRVPAASSDVPRVVWPSPDWNDPAIVRAPAALAAVLDEAFTEPVGERPRRTRAVLVARAGRIVGERYAAGYGPDSALPGWSMTKSVTGALAGVLVREGKLSLDGPVDVPEWSGAGDPRHAITLRQLLRMESGLEFSESYTNPLNDVIWMLLGTGDMASFAAHKRLAATPGARWSYASGTTNLIARVLRRAAGDDAAYLGLPHRGLFDPLAMRSAIIEPDASGTFVGSSYMFASARDWARFGLLYLRDGVAGDARILPEGWVDFTTTPAPTAPDGAYGAHVWRRLPASYAPSGQAALPPDAFHAVGHEGQIVSVIPSRRLVAVRLGLSVGRGVWDHASFLARVLSALDGS